MVDNVDAAVICANPDCRVRESGRCVEGLDLQTCPHYGHEPGELTDEVAEGDESTPAPGVELPGAGTLSPAETSKLLRAGEARVIAIIGPSDAGKTSLIASLYDLFQEGPVLGIEYARSETLHAFEHTCHDARAASRRAVPHINRTPLGEVRFYHLEVGGAQAGDRLTLALGDRAGEEYRAAADDASVAPSFPEVRRADSLAVLVDGRRLLDSGARHNLRSEIILILQALVDGGAVQSGQRLALVLTKIDELLGSEHQARAERDFAALVADTRRILGLAFSIIEPFRIAASPKTNAVPRGTGVPELLSFWLERRPESRAAIATRRPSFLRAFARLVPLDS